MSFKRCSNDFLGFGGWGGILVFVPTTLDEFLGFPVINFLYEFVSYFHQLLWGFIILPSNSRNFTPNYTKVTQLIPSDLFV